VQRYAPTYVAGVVRPVIVDGHGVNHRGVVDGVCCRADDFPRDIYPDDAADQKPSIYFDPCRVAVKGFNDAANLAYADRRKKSAFPV